MSSTSLADFGIAGRTIVRRLARNSDGPICPECGYPVAQSVGTQTVTSPQVVDDRYDVDGVLLVHGYECDQHAYPVVLPSRAGGSDAGRFDGWVGVLLVFSDDVRRYVASPRADVEARGYL